MCLSIAALSKPVNVEQTLGKVRGVEVPLQDIRTQESARVGVYQVEEEEQEEEEVQQEEEVEEEEIREEEEEEAVTKDGGHQTTLMFPMQMKKTESQKKTSMMLTRVENPALEMSST